jgi:hypothetical protein
MSSLGLTYEEFQELQHLCYWIDLSRRPRDFDFRAFLLGRLENKNSSTRQKIEQLPDDHIELLCREITEFQKLFR